MMILRRWWGASAPTPDDDAPRDAATAPVARDLRDLAATLDPAAAFVRDLEGRLRAQADARPRPGDERPSRAAQALSGPRGRARTRAVALRCAVLAALALLVLGGGLWASPGARASAGRLACLLPGLGIGGCAPTTIVAAHPVAVARDGVTLTVTRLVSDEGGTRVRVEISGLPMPPSADLVGGVRLGLTDDAGRAPTRARGSFGQGIVSLGAPPVALTTTFDYALEATFAALEPGTRAVDIAVDGGAPIGTWRVRVPVVPADEAALAPAREGAVGVTLHGITVRAASVAVDPLGLGVQLTARADPAVGVVRGVRPDASRGALVLQDDRGRQSPERQPDLGQRPPDASGVLTAGALFPPLAADAHAATLIVPLVLVQETGGAATLAIPVAGHRAGDRLPVDGVVLIGPYPMRVTDVTLAQDNKGNWRLWFTLDLGDWSPAGRKLVGPGVASVDGGAPVGCGATLGGDVAQETRRCVELPGGPDRDVTVTFSQPVVAVRGPWALEVPLPGKP
jgi:hypothetical protein